MPRYLHAWPCSEKGSKQCVSLIPSGPPPAEAPALSLSFYKKDIILVRRVHDAPQFRDQHRNRNQAPYVPVSRDSHAFQMILRQYLSYFFPSQSISGQFLLGLVDLPWLPLDENKVPSGNYSLEGPIVGKPFGITTELGESNHW